MALAEDICAEEMASVAEAPADAAQADDTNENAKAQSEEKLAEHVQAEEPLVEPRELNEKAEAAEAQADGASVDAKDDAQAAEEAQSMEVAQARPEVPEASEQPKSSEMPQASSTSRRKRVSAASKAAPCLEAMAGKIKRLTDEADQARSLLKEKEAEIAGLRAEAEAKDAAAQRAAQEYVKKQSEAALAHLESCIPKRPPGPFVVFCQEVNLNGKAASERWSSMSAQEKRKYQDLVKELEKKFHEWSSSPEGRKNLQERQEILRKARADGIEGLGKAVEALAEASPTKRQAAAPAAETPVKHRRTDVKVSTASTGLILDEKVLEEATKADLVGQLRNLAGRPDVCASGKSSQELLDALKAHNGMVNAAKRSLLSA